ncbi:MAG TPA: SCP2 sterol-binding domain-containing protein [Alphaproteobacteria bacterium]|jgi:putative sterol carrier protein|nr:SCP2 sterol-binding domain-containing protein [Alphaproteobacteria bacterium]
MNVAQLTERVRSAVGAESGLDATIKFNFGDEGVIYIDGKSTPNAVTNDNRDSQIVISFTPETLTRILDKQLNPKVALMTGKMKLRGDLRIAMRLDKVFGTG